MAYGREMNDNKTESKLSRDFGENCGDKETATIHDTVRKDLFNY